MTGMKRLDSFSAETGLKPETLPRGASHRKAVPDEATMTTHVDRFSPALAAAMKRHEDELVDFSARVTHVLSVEQEFVRVTKGKPFVVYHDAAWRMFHSEIDMVIVDLASWALGFYKKGGGGLLRQLRGADLQALALEWKRTGGHVIMVGGLEPEDDEWAQQAIDADVQRRNAQWRQWAFDRLFLGGTHGSVPNVPCQQDVDALCDRLATQFETLHDDRNQHRAHRFEKGPKTAAVLSLEDVKKHLQACQSLLADLRCLASNSHFTSYRYDPAAHEKDEDAQDIVDLVLCGIGDIANFGALARTDPAERYYWQKRAARYDALHAAHVVRGEPNEPFNDRSRLDHA